MEPRSLAILAVSSLFACAAAGCSGGNQEDLGSAGQDVTEVCGAKTTGPVQGVDVSHYQGNFDWAAAKVSFGYAQVSDGVTNPDPMFDTNWANMKSAKVLRGAYQFFRPDEDEVAQANLVVKKIGKLAPGDLPALIDVEVTGGETGPTIAAKVKKWISIVEAGTGLKPFIYAGSYFWQDSVGDTTLGAVPIWIAAYGSTCPSVPPGWKNWLFWQYSDGDGKLDHDVFNGTLAQLRALSPQAPPVPGQADGGVKDAGSEDAEAPAREKSDAEAPDADTSTSNGSDTGSSGTSGTASGSNDDAGAEGASPTGGESGGCNVASTKGGTPTNDGSAIFATALAAAALLRLRRRRA